MFLDVEYYEDDHIEGLRTASELSTDYNQVVLDYDGVIGEADSNHTGPSKDSIGPEVTDLVDEIKERSEVYIFSNRKNNGGSMEGLDEILEVRDSALKDSSGNKALKSSWNEINEDLGNDVLVVEDSFSGILGAKRHGYDTIYIENRSGSYTGFLGVAKEFEDFLAKRFLSE